MFTNQAQINAQLEEIQRAGLYKAERIITTPQNARVRVKTGAEVLNMCANNYLGLSDHPEIVTAARESLDKWGFGLSSVRFICGTQTIHKTLEEAISRFLGIGGGSDCTGTYGTAENSQKLHSVADLFIAQERGVWWDLCVGNLGDGLDQALEVIETACDEFEPEVD